MPTAKQDGRVFDKHKTLSHLQLDGSVRVLPDVGTLCCALFLSMSCRIGSTSLVNEPKYFWHCHSNLFQGLIILFMPQPERQCYTVQNAGNDSNSLTSPSLDSIIRVVDLCHDPEPDSLTESKTTSVHVCNVIRQEDAAVRRMMRSVSSARIAALRIVERAHSTLTCLQNLTKT